MVKIRAGRALIATHNLIDYAGAEISTLELATELREMGWTVCVAAFLSGEPMFSEFEKFGFQIVDILDADSAISNSQFDLAWIHHAPVLYELFTTHKIRAALVIFCSLSHFEPLEAVPTHRGKIDLLLANSIENKNFITKQYNLDSNQVILFPNSVPKIYWKQFKEFHRTSLKRVVVISNHPPREVFDVMGILKSNGIEVDHVGYGGTQSLVSPNLLLNYDAVITIGKTVPFCFALKVPVYCYDHFGGPGWLDEDNFNLASQNNFSGRGFSKKSSEAITHEMITGYRESVHRLDKHRNHAIQFHSLDKNLERLFEHSKISFEQQLNATEIIRKSTQHAQYMRLVRILRTYTAELNASKKEVLRVKTTLSWRLTIPFRIVYNFVFHIIDVTKSKHGR